MKIQATLFAAALVLVPAVASAQSSSTGSSSNTGSSSTTSSGMPTNDSKTSATGGYQPIGSQPPSQTTGTTGSSQASASDRNRDDMTNKKLDQTHLLQKLHHVNQEEIKAGQLAQKKGSSSDVKTYGKMLVQDHTQADGDLTALAKNMSVDLTAMKMDEHAREKREVKEHKMDQLQKMTGKDFDRGFAQMMANGHQQVIDVVKNSRDDTKPNVQAFLDKQLPVLQKHLDMAKDILSKTGNTASAR
jgi:putative membrane protein